MTTPSAPSPQPVPTPVPVTLAPEQPKEIRIVSHCTLFYWWPVWVVGFLMAGITMVSNQRMVLVDKAAVFHKSADVVAAVGEKMERAEGVPVWQLSKPSEKNKEKPISNEEMLRISPSKNLGVVFVIVLLIVIAITNVPLRGLWSLIVLVVIVSLSIIFALLDWWTPILDFLRIVDIRINCEGYLVISTVLFLLWLVVFFFFDEQVYMVFQPGILRVRLEIGDAETAYDTTGMTVQKQRSDLFRHYVLGLGSGDLIVNTAGAQAHHFDMPNVLGIGRKVRMIEELVSSRNIVSGND